MCTPALLGGGLHYRRLGNIWQQNYHSPNSNHSFEADLETHTCCKGILTKIYLALDEEPKNSIPSSAADHTLHDISHRIQVSKDECQDGEQERVQEVERCPEIKSRIRCTLDAVVIIH